MGKFASEFLKFLGSFKLSFWLFVLLLWLTFWGTWAQAKMSLYDVQSDYFKSIFVVYWIGDKFPVPMLGGYFLLSILFVNLLVGGILRIRKRVRILGILVAHLGVIFLLVGSFIEFQRKTEGTVRLYPGESSSEYKSSEDWEIAIEVRLPNGKAKEYVIPPDGFTHLKAGEATTFTHPDLPFDVGLSQYARNAMVRRSRSGNPHGGGGVEGPSRGSAGGVVLVPLEPVGPGGFVNRPAVMATIRPRSGPAHRGILLGDDDIFRLEPPSMHAPSKPYVFAQGGVLYSVDLRFVRMQLPFSIRLNKFVHKTHAGTSMAKEFSSYVTKIERTGGGGKQVEEDHHITMNAPLRQSGFTFYQSSWGPQGDDLPPGTPLYSQFAVVNNPTDRWPLIACVIIAVGLLIHFIMKLVFYLEAEGKRGARARGEA